MDPEILLNSCESRLELLSLVNAGITDRDLTFLQQLEILYTDLQVLLRIYDINDLDDEVADLEEEGISNLREILDSPWQSIIRIPQGWSRMIPCRLTRWVAVDKEQAVINGSAWFSSTSEWLLRTLGSREYFSFPRTYFFCPYMVENSRR